ncbi:hypothetical protein VNO78_05384 [Psophocarpus tetragonolobus]|uniref:Uncharacterized protein n=1 Tax=Psophocarpus tetragonolobus TaxID=3891 RepID=A0AAN9XR24_PSOTE
MSAMVQVWVGELTKLGEKVLAGKSFLSKPKEGSERKQEEKHAQVQKKENIASSGTMSEATVCLLMDRFVPW